MHISVHFIYYIRTQFAPKDISDGEISNCSSFETNPNDVTVIPATSSAIAIGKGQSKYITDLDAKKKKSQQKSVFCFEQ